MTNTSQLQAQKAASRDKQRYVRMSYGGTSCVVQPHEVKDMLDGDHTQEYEFKYVWMTQAEYEALPEFTGW